MGFRSWDNNASSTEKAVVTTTFAVQATAGATYDIGLTVRVGAGSSPVDIQKQNVQIDVLSGDEVTKLAWVHTSNGVPYPDVVEGYTTQYTWDTNPQPYSTTVTADDSGTMTIRLVFTLDPTGDVNDDIRIDDITVTQQACAA